jgi:hypothetical protein
MNDDSNNECIHIFVSYAREDARWLDPRYKNNLIPFLVDSLHRSNVAFWYDKELNGGDEFKRRIQEEIDHAHIAVLIVSQCFLNSDFIANEEMPRIEDRAKRGNLLIVPVLVEPCEWLECDTLAARQMVPGSIPLIEFTESEAKWARVRSEILAAFRVQIKNIRKSINAETGSERSCETPFDRLQTSQRSTEKFQATVSDRATSETNSVDRACDRQTFTGESHRTVFICLFAGV